jgi:hypothetical protein
LKLWNRHIPLSAREHSAQVFPNIHMRASGE